MLTPLGLIAFAGGIQFCDWTGIHDLPKYGTRYVVWTDAKLILEEHGRDSLSGGQKALDIIAKKSVKYKFTSP